MASNYAAKYSEHINIAFSNLSSSMQQQILNQAGIMNNPDELDIRENAFEGMDDFMILTQRTKQRNQHIRKVILTPEQMRILSQDPVMVQSGSSVFGRTPKIAQLYGYELEVRK